MIDSLRRQARGLRAGLMLGASLALTACGGGGSSGGGSEPPPPPPPPPAVSKTEAFRFLNQATFGATETEAEAVVDSGIEAWIDQQLNTPASLQLPYLRSLPRPDFPGQLQPDRVDIWFRNVVDGPDQLRQRVAFALSQIMVVSQLGALEGAPWALADYGFRVLIAPSFADIFHQNAIKNGLLPVVLDEAVIDELFELATQDEPLEMEIDLHNLTLHPGRGHETLGAIEIVIDPFHHHCLIHGLDDIGLTLQQEDAIAAYEQRRRAEAPWLFA